MKPHPRMRATIKWGGAVITVLLLIVWVGSGWYEARGGLFPTIGAAVCPGQLFVGWGKPWSLKPTSCKWQVDAYRHRKPFNWWFFCFRSQQETGIAVPIWVLVFAAGVPTWFIWRRDRKRSLIGVCPKCGYSRTGLPPDRACPECGTAVQTQKAEMQKAEIT